MIIKKILFVIKQRYNPYPFYWFDLLTERHVKNRRGVCNDCVMCCMYSCACLREQEGLCYCMYVDLEKKRCKVYDKRTCNIWFPVSQKEIDHRTKIQPDFKCKFIFSNNNYRKGQTQWKI